MANERAVRTSHSIRSVIPGIVFAAMGITFMVCGSPPVAAAVLGTTEFVPGSTSGIWDHPVGFQITITSSGDDLDDVATGGGSAGPDDFYFELSSTAYADGTWFLNDIVLVNPSPTLGAGLASYSDAGVVVQLGAVASAWIDDPARLIEQVNEQTLDVGAAIDHYAFVGFDAGISSFTITIVPEPATLPLLTLGMLMAWRRR